MGYIFIIYYSAISYKKEGKSYIISIILYMITLILSIIPIMVFINFIAGLVQLIQLILLIYFVKNMDNTKVASKAIVLFTVLSIVVSIIIYLNGYGIRSMDGIPSMFLSGTYALIYYVDKKLPLFNKS